MKLLFRRLPGRAQPARLAVILGLGLLAGLVMGAGPEQEPVCPQGDPPTGCVQVALWPDTLTADFFIGEQQLAGGANPGFLHVTPRETVRIDARNVRDSSEGFGDAFIYEDAFTNVWVSEGQLRTSVVAP